MTSGWWLVASEKLWKFTLRRLRGIVDAADEWIHAREVSLRDAAAKVEYLEAVDPVASRVREKQNRRERLGGTGAVSSIAGFHKPILTAPPSGSRRNRGMTAAQFDAKYAREMA